MLINGACQCDLGYIGATCQQKDPYLLVGRPVKRKTVLLIVDTFHPFDITESGGGISAALLSQKLTRLGMKVTVLLLYPVKGGQFQSLKKWCNDRRIRLEKLPPLQIAVGYDEPIQTSYALYRYLLSVSTEEPPSNNTPREAAGKERAYNLIWVFTYGASAYYSLLARKIGLVCIRSTIVVSLLGLCEALARKTLQKFHARKQPIEDMELSLCSGDNSSIHACSVANKLLPDRNQKDKRPFESGDWILKDMAALKDEYMWMKVLEMADSIIVTNRHLFDSIMKEHRDLFMTWQEPRKLFILPPLTTSRLLKKQEMSQKERESEEPDKRAEDGEERDRANLSVVETTGPIREFVYIGRLAALDGLIVFLDALEEVRSKMPDFQQNIKIVFIGEDAHLRPDEPLLGCCIGNSKDSTNKKAVPPSFMNGDEAMPFP
jgi:glycosyltransferase involved in cell wall biosynthesis